MKSGHGLSASFLTLIGFRTCLSYCYGSSLNYLNQLTRAILEASMLFDFMAVDR